MSFDRADPCKSEAFYQAWSRAHEFCQACGVHKNAAPWQPFSGGIGLSTHHVEKRGRAHEACNLIRLCNRDHRLAEGDTIRSNGVVLPTLTRHLCLLLKKLREPNEYDIDRIRELANEWVNDPDVGELIPDFLVVEWELRVASGQFD